MSLAEQYLLDFVAPPVLAIMWWLLSRNWAGVVQGGEVSGRTKRRQTIGFFVVLVVLYFLMFGATTYRYFHK